VARRGADESGDSLVEIVLALVIIGVVIGAFVATFSTGATASSSHRTIVTADVLLRNYAEQIKDATRDCHPGDTYPSAPAEAPPAGFSLGLRARDAGDPSTCPPPDAPKALDLSVTLPNGNTRSMSIDVRSPWTS
jgi:type II secretory pathway pseudopilin PulG